MKVWKETEIQEMLLNQHFLDFPLNIVSTAFYGKGYDSNYTECVI